MSDEHGLFTIFVKNLKLSYLTIHALNYKDKRVSLDNTLISDSLYIFKLSVYNIELDEIKIKANRRYTDTSYIDLSKLNFDRSFSINDLLSASFGFTKDSKGQLYYKGKAVNDVVVDGGEFFGKDNKDIHKLLPALILEGINVVETNIDSITNTTLLRPTIKINLNLKDEYKSGSFGTLSLGIGSSKRFIINPNLYTYRKKEQINLNINYNNINIDDSFSVAPTVGFSANGNDITRKNLSFTYKNAFSNKLEYTIGIKGGDLSKFFNYESNRIDELLGQSAKTFSATNLTSYNLRGADLSVHYKIDSTSSLSYAQTFSYNKDKQTDSLYYDIITRTDSQTVNTIRQTDRVIKAFSKKLNFVKRLSSKRGRQINVLLNHVAATNNNYEDNLISISKSTHKNYFIDSDAKNKEESLTLNADFTEPITTSSYVNAFFQYAYSNALNKTSVISDTVSVPDNVIDLNNKFFKSGLKYQKTFQNSSLDFALTSLFNKRTITDNKSNLSFFNLNADLKIDFKISSKKTLLINYKTETNYPVISQLVNISNSYDQVSQQRGNSELKPENKSSLILSYNLKSSESKTVNVSGNLDYYTSKFGYKTSLINNTQVSYYDNIGSAIAGKLGIDLQVNINKTTSVNTSSSLFYLENPALINDRKILNKTNSFNQTLSTSLSLMQYLSISPTLSLSYHISSYDGFENKILNFTYSDRLSLNYKQVEFNIYPLLSYNKGISENFSWSANSEIKVTIKNNISLWIQGYDIFKTFEYYNNIIGPSYVQNTKYSNLSRYVILGLNLNFNNMK